MRIIGVDPGTSKMGYGLVEGEPLTVVDWGTLSPPRSASTADKLMTLYQKLEQILLLHHPAEMAVEEPFVSRNPRSSLAVGRAQAMALLLAAQHGLPVRCYTPAQIKQRIANYGAGDKSQVQEMVRLLLNLETLPQPDAADALAVALCHYFYLQLPLPLRQG